MNFKKKKYFKYIFLFLFSFVIIISLANYIITSSTKYFISDNLSELPSCKVALLLGTSKNLKSGQPNAYFYNRIKAAVELMKSGKVKYIIINGDNRYSYYNEPQDMKNELIKNGIPDSVIYLDYAGFRTFDSVIRASEIFGQSAFIVVSQQFHNERAIYIARHFNIHAYGYNAKDVNAYNGFKTKTREMFARVKVFIDILIGQKPKFLGEKISVGKTV